MGFSIGMVVDAALSRMQERGGTSEEHVYPTEDDPICGDEPLSQQPFVEAQRFEAPSMRTGPLH